MDGHVLHGVCVKVTCLLRRLRQGGYLQHLSQLGERAMWDAAIAGLSRPSKGSNNPALPPGIAHEILMYSALTGTHLNHYLAEVLDADLRRTWQRELDACHPDAPVRYEDWLLPRLPHRFLARSGIRQGVKAGGQRRRKAQTDVMTPLHPVLVQVALLRKQAMGRLRDACRQARAEGGRGSCLPHAFSHIARIPFVNQQARSVAAVEIGYREVKLDLVLWDRHSWAEAHLDRSTPGHRGDVDRRRGAYGPRRNALFVQCLNPPDDLLWFGQILAAGALGATRFNSGRRSKTSTVDEPGGFFTERTGLLNPIKSDALWMRHNIGPDEIAFDPEALYRGVLYGAALAVVALTSGARLTELLQISDRRWDVIAVDEMRGGKQTGRHVEILVQHLLPKGHKTEDRRQPFLISEQAQPLLKEIIDILTEAHGHVPVIRPTGNAKEAHLSKEPYIFQWASGADGRIGLISGQDVTKLLRFLFFGLEMTTQAGDRIRIAPHLCRHILATTARHDYEVPLEAVAYLLHHRVAPDGDRPLSVTEATHYYSEMSRDRQLALLHELQGEIARRSCQYPMRPPTERELEEMDGWLREVFENWGTIGPVTLGFCSAGMCVRPDNRAQCVGCPFLVEDHRKLGAALRWRALYERDIARHEADGDMAEARQRRRALETLDGHINVMRLQRQVLADGGALPHFLSMSVPEGDEEGGVVDG